MAVQIPAALKGLRPLRNGYAVKGEALIESEVDQGAPKQRPLSTAPIRTASAVFRMTRSVYRDTFIAFYHADLAGGSAWFDWVEPLSGCAVQAQFIGKAPPTVIGVAGGRIDVQAAIRIRD